MQQIHKLALLVGAGLYTFGLSCAAEVYKWVDERGVVQYTQTPPTQRDANVIGGHKNAALSQGEGITQLFRAIRDNRTQQVRQLLDRGVSVNTRDTNMQTPLIYAASLNRLKMLELLLASGADINTTQGSQTALFKAVMLGHKESVALLLRRNANPNLGDENTGPPLLVAIDKSYHDIALLLIRHGSRLDSRNLRGYTPLIKAVHSGSITLVQTLLNHRANVNTADEDGDTPLMHAACCASAEIAQLLIRYQADIQLKNRRGQSALDKAMLASNQAVLSLLSPPKLIPAKK